MNTRSCGLGNGLLLFKFFSFFMLKKGWLFKSLEHAWEVDLEGRKLSLVSPLCLLPRLQVSAGELGQFSEVG